MSRRITFIVYRPNSMDMANAHLYDSIDSTIEIMEFTDFARHLVHEYLVRVFTEDRRTRENAKWIKPVQVTSLVNGQQLESVDIDTAIDVLHMIANAQEEADRV